MEEIKLSERLDELMFENSIDAITLGKQIGVSKMTIYRYLSKKRMPKIDIIIKLADYFNCSLDFFIGLSDDNKSTAFKSPPIFSEQFKFILNKYNTTEYFVHKNRKISRSVLFSWLNGTRLPSIESLITLAKHFNCSVDYIVGREN